MKVTPLHEVAPRARRVAVGTFDGVHLGHREVIAGADTVLTFDPHPMTVVWPGSEPVLLTTFARKAELIATLGVQELVVIPFDATFAAQSPQAFIDEILVARLGATHVSVGENFRFGARAQGDADLLAADGRFSVSVTPLLEVDGEIVSSSHIRGLVLGGAIEYAGTLLGDPFVVDGPVVRGDERARPLGFPTANLVPHEHFCTPGHGVYACRVRTADGAWHPAATTIGVRPMFESGLGELIEAHVIDFDGDLYGQDIRIEFRKRLHGERRLESPGAFTAQMQRDVVEARAIAAAVA